MKRVLLLCVYIVSSLFWGPAIEASFQLDYVEGIQPTDGIRLGSDRTVVGPYEPHWVAQPRPVPVQATRRPPTRLPSSRASGNDFWRRLANCESPSGVSGRFIGYFQFSRDTARKVGIDGSESYEEQRAAAQHWASLVSPGTSAGWPHCWHVASR